MGITSRNIFGAVNTQPAIPGSYGEVPLDGRLPEETHLGKVRLQIADLDRSVDFYTRVLGFEVAHRDGTHAKLRARGASRADAGDETPVLIELHERTGAPPAQRDQLGLYHFAILLPDRASLGRLLPHLIEAGVMPGSADHLVSEALYLNDPDGLGIEVNADRPRDAWRRNGRELLLATDPLDVEDLMRSAGGARWTGMPAGTVIGHLHLHVGDLAEAAAFYSDALGFDRTMWSYPGALFLSAGGYHHHLGTNLWAGASARPAADDAARLLEWTIELPNPDDVHAVEERMHNGGYDVERDGDALLLRDPWGTTLRVVTESGA